MTDLLILAEIKHDVNAGFKCLVSRYSSRIYWHIRRIVISHQDAEDVTQEVFLRVFKAINKLKTAEALNTWIYKIATNEALRAIEKRNESLPLEWAAESEADNYINYDDIESFQLKKAIAVLPCKQQITFNLRYYDELEYAEIATILGTTVGNARANYHNAKQRIIKYMNSIH